MRIPNLSGSHSPKRGCRNRDSLFNFKPYLFFSLFSFLCIGLRDRSVMRNGYSYNDCFRIGNKYHIFISSDCKIFNLNNITGFESAQINFNGLNQSFRQCFICDLFQLLFNYTGLDFLMVYMKPASLTPGRLWAL